jgi:deoxyribose-phosphate aldolase
MQSRDDQVAKLIDHAVLGPQQTAGDLESACRLAREYRVASVCVTPCLLRSCVERLRGSGVAPGAVVAFPHGTHVPAVKAAETEQALADGAQEIDAVIHVGNVLNGDWTAVRCDLTAVIDPCRQAGRIVKIIFETCYLNDEQKVRLCGLCVELGADFVKTSTGYGPEGATLHDVRLMRRSVPDHVGVKASGGIRTLDDLLAFREAGATRIGCSRTFSLLDEYSARREHGGDDG